MARGTATALGTEPRTAPTNAYSRHYAQQRVAPKDLIITPTTRVMRPLALGTAPLASAVVVSADAAGSGTRAENLLEQWPRRAGRMRCANAGGRRACQRQAGRLGGLVLEMEQD